MNPDSAQRQSKRFGVIAALAAYGAWGLVPIYFKWVNQVGLIEIIAHRVVWAIPPLAVFLLFRDGKAWLSKLHVSTRDLAGLALAAALISAVWLVFVWAVVNDQVLSTSLGYFINPLINILLGYLFLHERLTTYQKVAVSIAAIGTLYMAWSVGVTPWVSLLLPTLFGFYGLVRKQLSVGPMTGLMWENLLLLAPALVYLFWRSSQGQMDFLHQDPLVDYLLLLAGLVTILPLIWYITAARILSLSVVGFFMYIGPTISMLLAVFLWNEPFTRGHAVAFGCIWLGLALVTFEQVSLARGRPKLG